MFCAACGREDKIYHYRLLLRRGPCGLLTLCVGCHARLLRQPPPRQQIGGGALTQESHLRGVATIQAQADAFAHSMGGTIAELERAGVVSSNAMAQALTARGVATARSRRWNANTVIALRHRLRRLGL